MTAQNKYSQIDITNDYRTHDKEWTDHDVINGLIGDARGERYNRDFPNAVAICNEVSGEQLKRVLSMETEQVYLRDLYEHNKHVKGIASPVPGESTEADPNFPAIEYRRWYINYPLSIYSSYAGGPGPSYDPEDDLKDEESPEKEIPCTVADCIVDQKNSEVLHYIAKIAGERSDFSFEDFKNAVNRCPESRYAPKDEHGFEVYDLASRTGEIPEELNETEKERKRLVDSAERKRIIKDQDWEKDYVEFERGMVLYKVNMAIDDKGYLESSNINNDAYNVSSEKKEDVLKELGIDGDNLLKSAHKI